MSRQRGSLIKGHGVAPPFLGLSFPWRTCDEMALWCVELDKASTGLPAFPCDLLREVRRQGDAVGREGWREGTKEGKGGRERILHLESAVGGEGQKDGSAGATRTCN